MNKEIILAVPQEFSFTEMISYLTRSPQECMFQVIDHKIFKLIPVTEGDFIIEISGEQPGQLSVCIFDKTTPLDDKAVSDQTVNDIKEYITDWLDLGRDLKPFYNMAFQDPYLQQVADRFYGLRCIGIPDLFEALCWGIIGQQINLTFAYTLKRRLVETFGRNVEWDGRKYWSFPSPLIIAGLAVNDLAGLQMTVKKAEYLIGTAKLMAEGTLSKELLLEMKDINEMEKYLVSIRGIGPWTAHYVLMRCLRAQTALPLADVGLHNALKLILGWDRKPTIEEVKQMAEGWKGWQAYATFYLWRVVSIQADSN